MGHPPLGHEQGLRRRRAAQVRGHPGSRALVSSGALDRVQFRAPIDPEQPYIERCVVRGACGKADDRAGNSCPTTNEYPLRRPLDDFPRAMGGSSLLVEGKHLFRGVIWLWRQVGKSPGSRAGSVGEPQARSDFNGTGGGARLLVQRCGGTTSRTSRALPAGVARARASRGMRRDGLSGAWVRPEGSAPRSARRGPQPLPPALHPSRRRPGPGGGARGGR